MVQRSTVLTTDTLTAFSANANLLARSGSAPALTIPLVQGMGYVTAIYKGATPYIESSVFFQTVTPVASPKKGVSKYRILLNDGNTWLLYATANNGTGFSLNLKSSSRLAAPGPFSGTIQIAKNPGNVAAQERQYDGCSGSYATGTSLSGSSSGSSATYSLNFQKAGNGSPLIMFALPHHIASMSYTTDAGKTDIKLQTTTKGTAVGVIADTWTLVESNLPVTIGFAPWNENSGSTTSIPLSAKEAIDAAATSELSQDMDAQTNLDSMYYSGKALSKFATAIYAVHDLSGNVSLANAGLAKLKTAFSRFAANQQKYPLTYESAWGGVVSTASYVTGDPNVDFGNTYYNDHQ